MASRREFLQMGVAALALPISAHAAFSPTPSVVSSEPVTPLYKVIFDERFASSRAFASEVKTLGADIHGIKGDITDFWYHDLYARWKESPVAIAGLTAHGPIFCLERLAWDQRMRVVYRADHRYQADGSIEHAVSGPASMLRQAAELGDGGTEWTSVVANLVTKCPVGKFQASQTNIVAPTGNQSDDPEHLISWVIAPVNRT
jgi:hypothetical protein